MLLQVAGFPSFFFFFLRLNACMHSQLLSGVWLFGTVWTVVCQAPLSMGFSRQEHWNGLPFLASWDLSSLGQTHVFCIAGRFFTTDPLGKPYSWILFTYQHLSLSLSVYCSSSHLSLPSITFSPSSHPSVHVFLPLGISSITSIG